MAEFHPSTIDNTALQLLDLFHQTTHRPTDAKLTAQSLNKAVYPSATTIIYDGKAIYKRKQCQVEMESHSHTAYLNS